MHPKQNQTTIHNYMYVYSYVYAYLQWDLLRLPQAQLTGLCNVFVCLCICLLE